MYWLFFICALGGGTVMVVQFLMSLIGLGGDLLESVGAADADFDGGAGGIDSDGIDSGAHHSTDWLFKVVSFRTIVAALAFFGIGGLAARAGGQPEITQAAIATLAGVTAMYGVFFLMRSMQKLQQDGTFRIERTVGATGAVYIPIPPAGAGAGKVQLQAHGRIVELKAVSQRPEKLRTGAKVVVVDVISHDTVEVAPVSEGAPSDPAKAELA